MTGNAVHGARQEEGLQQSEGWRLLLCGTGGAAKRLHRCLKYRRPVGHHSLA